MKEKNILIHVKSDEALNNYIRILKQGKYDESIPYSKEIKAMLTEFLENGWNCFLTTMENFDKDNEIFNKVYCIKEDKLYNMSITDVNKNIPVMIIRNVGPLELNFDKIQEYLKYIINNYKGKVLNNPKAMLKVLDLPELTYSALGLQVGVPDQEPQLKPRLPLEFTTFENEYPRDFEVSELKDYDEIVQTYYDLRDANRRIDSFTNQINGKKLNTHQNKRDDIVEAIHSQGLALDFN